MLSSAFWSRVTVIILIVTALACSQTDICSVKANAQGSVQSELSAEGFFVLPPVTQNRTTASVNVPYSAAAWSHAFIIERYQAGINQPFDAVLFPKDSIRVALSNSVKQWLATLKTTQIHGIQLDAYGGLL